MVNNLEMETSEAVKKVIPENGKVTSSPCSTEESQIYLPSDRYSVAELLDAEYPEPRWAIPGIIPEGLTIFGGRPKVGKSWLMLQSAWSVGIGGRFLDQEVKRGNVLYFALEDSRRRLQDRIKSMGIDRNSSITFINRFMPLHEEGLNYLLIELERVDYRLIVIDTLTRAIPGVDQKNDDGKVSKLFDGLQHISMSHQTAIVLVDHTRKPSGYNADPIDDIIHTTAKTAIADSIMVLYKQQGKSGAKLMGRGRDMEDFDHSIRFDSSTRAWQIDCPELPEKFVEILDALEKLGKAQIGEIAEFTGQNRGNLHKRLQNLVEKGHLIREKKGTNVFYEKVGKQTKQQLSLLV